MLHDFPRNMLIVVLVNAFNDIISVFAVLHFDNDLIPGLQFILYNGKITEFAAVSIVPRKDNVAACVQTQRALHHNKRTLVLFNASAYFRQEVSTWTSNKTFAPLSAMPAA